MGSLWIVIKNGFKRGNTFVNTQVLMCNSKFMCFCVATLYCTTSFRDVQGCCRYFYFTFFTSRFMFPQFLWRFYGRIFYYMFPQRFLQIGVLLFLFITSNSQIGLHNCHSNCKFTRCIVTAENAIPRANARQSTFTSPFTAQCIEPENAYLQRRRANNACTWIVKIPAITIRSSFMQRALEGTKNSGMHAANSFTYHFCNISK